MQVFNSLGLALGAQFASLMGGKAPQEGEQVPFEVDTGPPVFGAPPLILAASVQKEVQANEQTPQAELLDLLDEILAKDDEELVARDFSSDAATLGVRIGDLKANLTRDDVGTILQSFGLEVPIGDDLRDLRQIRLDLADRIVAEGLPPNVRGVLYKFLKTVPQPAPAVPVVAEIPVQDETQAPLTIGEHVEKPDPRPLVERDTFGNFEKRGGQPDNRYEVEKEGGHDERADKTPRAFRPIRFENPRPILVGPPIFVPPAVQSNKVLDDPKIDLAERTKFRSVVRPLSADRAVQLTGSVKNPLARAVAGDLQPSKRPTFARPEETPLEFQLGRPDFAVNPRVRVSIEATPLGENEAINAMLGDMKVVDLDVSFVPLATVSSTQENVAAIAIKPIAGALENDLPDSDPLKIVLNDKFNEAEPFVKKDVRTKQSFAPVVPIETTPVNEEPTETRVDETLKREKSHAEKSVSADLDVLETPVLEREQMPIKTEVPAPLITRPAAQRLHRPLEKDQALAVRKSVLEVVQEMVSSRGHGRTVIRLQPEDLGSITVEVRSFGQNVDARVTASDERVRAALTHQRSDLVQGVENRGLSLDNFTVGKESSDPFGTGRGQNHSQSQTTRQEFERAAVLSGQHNDSPTVAEGPRNYETFRKVGLDTLA